MGKLYSPLMGEKHDSEEGIYAAKNLDEKARQIWVLILASLASFMVALDATVVTTALTTIHRDLGVSIADLEWTVNAYTLSFAVLLIAAAALGDRFGRRRMFVAGLLLFVGASAACALAHNIGWLIAARAIQGCGAALVAPLALTLLSAAFPPQQRARALGIFGSITGLALIAGPVVGGIIAQGLAWQWIFWLNVPIGLLVVALVLSRVQESFGPRTSLDLGGLLSISGASLGIVWGLVRGNSAGWGSFEVVATLVAGGLLAIVFVAWELRARAPMVPMHFFRSRAFSAGNAATFLQTTSLIGVVFFLAQFFQVAQGNGPLGAGLRLLPLTATLFVVAPLAGTLVNRVGEQSSGGRRIAPASDRDRLDRAGRRARPALCGTHCAADHRRLRRLVLPSHYAECGYQCGERGRNRQGFRRIQHVPSAWRCVRRGDPGGGVCRDRQPRLRPGFQQRLRERTERRRCPLAPGSDRRPGAARQAGQSN